MKFTFLFSIFSLIFALASDWDTRFEEVCKYDTFCKRLKAPDGTWLRLKPEVKALLSDADVQKEINSSANKYGVDPAAVAGAIAAENSLNVGVKDGVQTWLAKRMGITSIAGHNFSFGLGQIQLSAAKDADRHVAKLENREPKSDAELTQEIADPMGSIRIASTIIKKVQDDYAAQGFDLSKDPATLATLYNLGGSAKRAKQAKEEGRLPKVNYFGLFVEKYQGEIKSTLKITDKPAEPVTVLAIKEETQTITKKSKKDLALQDTLTKSVPILSAPSFCQTSGYGQNVENDVKAISYGAPVDSIDKGKTYTELSRALGCDLKPWKLIQSSDQKVGWISEESLKLATQSKLVSKTSCEVTPGKDCKEKMDSTTKDYKLEDKSPSEVYLKPIGMTKEPGFSGEDYMCSGIAPTMMMVNPPPQRTVSTGKIKKGISPNMRATINPNGRGMMGMGTNNGMYYYGYQQGSGTVGNAAAATPEQIENYKKEVNEVLGSLKTEQKRMADSLKLSNDDLIGARNPYGTIAWHLKYQADTLKSCINSLEGENYSCFTNLEEEKGILEGLRKNLNYEKKISIQEAMKLDQYLNSNGATGATSTLTGSVHEATPTELDSLSPIDIRNSLNKCHSRVVALSPKNGSDFIKNIKNISETKGNDEKIKAHAAQLIKFSKYCHARLNLISQPDNPGKLECTRPANYIMYGMHEFSKELLAELYKETPSLLRGEIEAFGPWMVTNDVVADILGSTTPNTSKPWYHSFCPNKTAEFIEDILKSNPCIKHIYIPSHWITKKLNNFGPKVVFRQFEKDDRYLVEYGDNKCK